MFAENRHTVKIEDTQAKTFEYVSKHFSLPMAVVFRVIFMTELWRLSIIPRVSEKKTWLNTSTVNNETIEFQMQMVPIIGLSEETQRQMLESFSSLEASQSSVFVSTWAHTLHQMTMDLAIVTEAKNDSSLDYLAVTTGHCYAVDARDFSKPKPNFTYRAFARQAMPSVQSVAPEANLPESEFIHLFLLHPKHPDLTNTERISEVRLLSRLLTVRGRENACFNVFANVRFECSAMTEDEYTEETTTPAQPETIMFSLEPAWPIYSWPFVWTAACRILYMRLYYLLSLFQEGKMSFAESTAIITPNGWPVFEKSFEAGELKLDWESKLVEEREKMFTETEGLPLAFSKREISDGYADFGFFNFIVQTILNKEFGRTISRCTIFDRFDQELTIVRLEFIENEPRKTVADANAFFIQGIEDAISSVNSFLDTYKASW